MFGNEILKHATDGLHFVALLGFDGHLQGSPGHLESGPWRDRRQQSKSLDPRESEREATHRERCDAPSVTGLPGSRILAADRFIRRAAGR
jgi:hypothetical protein